MRREILKKVKRVVIKVGSRVITSADAGLDAAVIGRLAAEVAGVLAENHEVIIVSSGAVAAGKKALGIDGKPQTIPQKQAAAAVGQSRLMHAYEEAFAIHDHKVAQILLTRDDLADRQRFLNARATLDTLLDCGIIPIINENDTVVVEEIKFGDNDNLSALVTNLTEAHLLVILTDIEGLYDRDPRANPDARLIPLVRSNHPGDGTRRRRHGIYGRHRRHGDQACCGQESRQVGGARHHHQRHDPRAARKGPGWRRCRHPVSGGAGGPQPAQALDRLYVAAAGENRCR